MRLLITGAAGFIGYHLAKACLEAGNEVIGLDNLNHYYDVQLKLARLERLKQYSNFHWVQGDICNLELVNETFADFRPQYVVHLAAQAGVRYSLNQPHLYIQSNLVGFGHVIEACRHYGIAHFIYASSSSVYGANTKQPYQENEETNHPLSMYAATKKANELMAHSYSSLYQLPTTGLRFFSVYGPWGRPDMAFFSFTQKIMGGETIEVYNFGKMARDFTYIDDIVNALSLVIEQPATADPTWNSHCPNAASSFSPYRIYNIGRGEPANLLDYIDAIEQFTGKKAIKQFLPLQKGDVLSTHADMKLFQKTFEYSPRVDIKEGVSRFVEWYKKYYV